MQLITEFVNQGLLPRSAFHGPLTPACVMQRVPRGSQVTPVVSRTARTRVPPAAL